ncbi:MAG: hypothetical protein ORO03_09820, partial [Alphaproteobacteria bacterium]|nr:hypothetical protein [Alphaproteobacteria bacterium]
NLGASDFVFVTDNRSTTTATILNNSTALPAAFTAGSGLTITTMGSKAGQGVVYGGTVDIQGVTTGVAKDLRYIEGTGVGVTTASTFSGNLLLVGSGAGYDLDSTTAAVFVKANLSTANRGDLSLVQIGGATKHGIIVSGATLTTSGAMNLIQSGGASNGIGIYVHSSSVLTAGTTMNLIQSGSVTSVAIYAQNATLTASGSLILLQSGYANSAITLEATTMTTISDLSLLQTGAPSSAGGISFKATGTGVNQGVALTAGSNSFVTLKTNNKSFSIEKYDNFSVSGGKLRIDLVGPTGRFSSWMNDVAIIDPANQFTLKALGMDVYYTSDFNFNSAKIDVGSGTFTFVNDRRTVTTAVTLSNSTNAQDSLNFWGPSKFAPDPLATPDSAVEYGGIKPSGGTRSGHLTITGTGGVSRLRGLGAVYGGTVEINALTLQVGEGGSNLRYIEGTGVAVTGASTFTGNLVLVGSSISVTASLTTSNGGDLTLLQTGVATGAGITVNSTLTSAGELLLLQAGTVGSANQGILFSNGAVSLAAGSNSFVTLKTNGFNLTSTANSAVTSGKIRIDLGSGAMVSKDSSGNEIANAANQFTLTATGLDVYYTGATSGNSAKISVGSGSFTYINDKRLVTAAVTLTNVTTESEAINGWGATPTYGTSGSDFILGGLTIIGTGGASKLKGLGVIYGGAVTINGVGSGDGTGGAKNLTYIEGTRVTVSGTASSFAGSLMLRASGNSSVTLGANLTTSGAIRFNATNLILSGHVTTAGGAVTIALGSGVYNSGAGGGFILTTSNQNLNLMAGSVVATNDATVFAVGTGTFTASAAVIAATTGTSSSKEFFDYDNSVANKKGSSKIGSVDPNDATILNWKFYGGTVGTPANDTVWMNNGSLTAAKVVQVETFSADSKAGLDTANIVNGNVKFKTKITAATPSTTVVPLTASKAVTFVSVGTSGAAVTVGTLPTATSVLFTGANFLTGDVTLGANGAITQAVGSTLSITSGKLIVTGSSAITLTNTGNALGSLGALTSTGAISITTGAGMTLNNNISAGGAIGLPATSMTLGSAVTTSGGAVTSSLGAAGVYATGGFTLNTSNQNLTLTAGSLTGAANDATVFTLGTGTLSATGLTVTVSSPALSEYFD